MTMTNPDMVTARTDGKEVAANENLESESLAKEILAKENSVNESEEIQLELGFSLDPESFNFIEEQVETAIEDEILVEAKSAETLVGVEDHAVVEGNSIADASDITAMAAAIEAVSNTPQNLFFSDVTSLPAALMDEKLLQEISSIPDKMAFKIGDVADLLGIKQYVLRYWETEFDVLKPKKASNNQRMYSKKDVENAFLIRKLLHRDRFSIEGARNALRALKAQVKKEKEVMHTVARAEEFHDRVNELVMDIKRIRMLFA